MLITPTFWLSSTTSQQTMDKEIRPVVADESRARNSDHSPVSDVRPESERRLQAKRSHVVLDITLKPFAVMDALASSVSGRPHPCGYPAQGRLARRQGSCRRIGRPKYGAPTDCVCRRIAPTCTIVTRAHDRDGTFYQQYQAGANGTSSASMFDRLAACGALCARKLGLSDSRLLSAADVLFARPASVRELGRALWRLSVRQAEQAYVARAKELPKGSGNRNSEAHRSRDKRKLRKHPPYRRLTKKTAPVIAQARLN